MGLQNQQKSKYLMEKWIQFKNGGLSSIIQSPQAEESVVRRNGREETLISLKNKAILLKK